MVLVLTVGHILTDLRILVDDFATPDRESKILGISRGLGGSAANVAVGIVRLGGSARIIGKIGMDGFGRLAVEELLKKKVDISGLKIDLLGETGFSIILINKKGEVIFYGRKGSADKLELNDINEGVFKNINFIHIASLSPNITKEISAMAKKHKIIVTYDPGRVIVKEGWVNLKNVFEYIDILLVNSKEALCLSMEENIQDALDFFIKKVDCDVIVKLGSKGAYVIKNKKSTYIHPYNVKGVDTTGAGDAFAAGLITRLSETHDLVEAAKFGNAVAALKIQRLGAQEIPTRQEVEEFLRDKEL